MASIESGTRIRVCVEIGGITVTFPISINSTVADLLAITISRSIEQGLANPNLRDRISDLCMTAKFDVHFCVICSDDTLADLRIKSENL